MAENNENYNDDHIEEKTFSRRDFLKRSGIAAGGVAAGGILGGMLGKSSVFSGSDTATESETDTASDSEDNVDDHGAAAEPTPDARTYFSRSEEFDTLAEATERIYPEDDNGPGAKDLGVPYFIDRQCNGAWGQNARDFMQGPFDYERAETHSLQSRLTRAQILLLGVREMLNIARNEHDDNFANLDDDTKDSILEDFESGDVDIPGVRSEDFFELLRTMTLEGVYSDPVYGGNRNYEGWKMMGYPGPRMGWAGQIQEEEFQEIEPEGLRTYQGGGY